MSMKNAVRDTCCCCGRPERFIKIKVSVFDASDKLLNYFKEHRIGSVYQWYPVVKLISDNRLAPNEKIH